MPCKFDFCLRPPTPTPVYAIVMCNLARLTLKCYYNTPSSRAGTKFCGAVDVESELTRIKRNMLQNISLIFSYLLVQKPTMSLSLQDRLSLVGGLVSTIN